MTKIVVLIFIFLNVLYADRKYNLDDVVEDQKSHIWKEKKSKKIANGFVFGTMSNGYTKEFTLKNGKLNGTYRMYDDNGPSSTVNYVNGVKHGLELIYSFSVPNQIMIKTEYVNGKKEGKSYFYNSGDGLLSEITTYNHDIKQDKKLFYKSGNLEELIKYDNGEKKSSLRYYESGKLLGEAKLTSSNMMNGKIFYKDGSLKTEMYSNTITHSGKLTTYYRNGNKEYEIYFQNEDEFYGYEYKNNKKYDLTYAQIHNYLKSREMWKGEE